MKIINYLFGLSFIALLAGCSASAEETEKNAAPAATKMETFGLQKDLLTSDLQLPGELIAFQQVDIYAKVASFVKELKVDIGSEVQAGQLLMVLEAPEVLSQMMAAESRLKSQEAVYGASKATYDRLVEASHTPGTVSKNDLDVAEAKKNADFANLEAAKASYKELSVIQSYLEIRAPFNGVISARNVNLGAYVGPAGKGSEFPIFTLQEQKRLRLAVSVPEAFASYLKNDDEVNFRVKAFPAEKFKAHIKRMAGALDLRLRAERIEMDVENDNKKLLPGMVAEVSLHLSAKDSSFVIPKTALVRSDEGIYVIAVVDHKTQRVPVSKGREVGDRVEVFGDLSNKATLLKKASEEIKDGTPVNL